MKQTKETQNIILERLAIKAQEEPSYPNISKLINTTYRYTIEELKDEHTQDRIRLREKHGIEAKERVAPKELSILFDMVLESGKNGTYVIRKYAELNNKSKKWIDDIAKPYPKKLIKKILEEKKEYFIVKKMIENKIYNPKEIYNKSVTGALSVLAKQMKAFQEKENDREKIEEYKRRLALNRLLIFSPLKAA